jgi:hypothetical protein
MYYCFTCKGWWLIHHYVVVKCVKFNKKYEHKYKGHTITVDGITNCPYCNPQGEEKNFTIEIIEGVKECNHHN